MEKLKNTTNINKILKMKTQSEHKQHSETEMRTRERESE